jgi:hypothetical protein
MHRRNVFEFRCIVGKQESKACLYMCGAGGDAHIVGVFCIPPHRTDGNVTAFPRKPNFIGVIPKCRKSI